MDEIYLHWKLVIIISLALHGVLINIIEFSCYIIIFYIIYKHDNIEAVLILKPQTIINQSNQCCNIDWPNNLFLYWNLVLDHRWINGHTLQWVSDERMGWNNQSSWLFLNSSGHGSYIIPIEELSKGYLNLYFLMVSINRCIIHSKLKVQAPLRRLFFLG